VIGRIALAGGRILTEAGSSIPFQWSLESRFRDGFVAAWWGVSS
jgi:hypothetical protein